MLLYHGTSAVALPTILAHGIKPRGAKGRSNWKHTVPSNPKTVYLTNAYALYYAQCAAKGKDDLVVFEVDTDRLPDLFVPDEDAFEQVWRGKDGKQGDMKSRTLYYRRLMVQFLGAVTQPGVHMSLQALGNCGFMGTVPVAAITRYAIIKRCDENQQLLWQALDPTITVMNYRICGPRYRNMVRWVFGWPLEHEPQIAGFCFTPPNSRAGIELHTHAWKGGETN